MLELRDGLANEAGRQQESIAQSQGDSVIRGRKASSKLHGTEVSALHETGVAR